MVWRRELIRFVRTRPRILTGLVQPLLFLFVLGYGMSSLVGTTGGFDFKKFVFPGIVAMSVVSTAIFAAMSIVWDREFGFLREMLIAPVSRTALVLGKTAGGATIATLQGSIMLLLAPLIGVRLTPLLVAQVILLELLMAVALTAFGVFVASRISKMESFQVVDAASAASNALPVGCDVPPRRIAAVARGGDSHQSADVRGRPAAARRLRGAANAAGGPATIPDGG